MNIATRAIAGAVAFCAAVLAGSGQDFIPGKIYVAEIAGGISFTVGGSPNVLKKGDTLPIQGARNETAPAAHVVFVYSNGTSLYIDEKTVVQIAKFEQRPFPKGTDITVNEPSVSHTMGRITQGRIIITTNKLATGTTMIYLTPHAEVKIRGQEVVIEVDDRESRVDVVNGDVTVTPVGGSTRGIGQVLHSGQEAVVTDSSAGSSSTPLQVLAINQSRLDSLASQLAAGDRARLIVVFETVPGAGGPEIQSTPVVPTNLPVQLTVSPSTLRNGQ
jgi:FecR protein